MGRTDPSKSRGRFCFSFYSLQIRSKSNLFRWQCATYVCQSWDILGYYVFSNKNEKITAIADNPNRSKEVFIATVIEPSKITKLYYSQDAGKHLLLIDNSIPERMIRDIIIDPNEENRLYICLGSYGRPGIMVSTNYGLDWNFLDNNYLPDVPIHCLIIDPNDSNILYAGTDLGLFLAQIKEAIGNPIIRIHLIL